MQDNTAKIKVELEALVPRPHHVAYKTLSEYVSISSAQIEREKTST